MKVVNKYEMVVILKAGLTEEGRKAALDRLTEAISENGSVQDIDDWGIRKLAYAIHFNKEGYYYLLTFEADPSVIVEVERRARILDPVLRFLTIRKEA